MFFKSIYPFYQVDIDFLRNKIRNVIAQKNVIEAAGACVLRGSRSLAFRPRCEVAMPDGNPVSRRGRDVKKQDEFAKRFSVYDSEVLGRVVTCGRRLSHHVGLVIEEISMPYVISAPDFCAQFPPGCPFCGAPQANGSYQQPYAKMKLSRIPGHATSDSRLVALPACADCSRWFSSTRILVFILGALMLFEPFAALVVNSNVIVVVWGGLLGAWILLTLWRRQRETALRVAYVGENEVVYTVRNERYASEFARLNALPYEQRACVVRWS